MAHVPRGTSLCTPTSRPTPVAGVAPGWSVTALCGTRSSPRLKQGWSPEQVAGRLALETGKRVISHETIYRFIYAQLARKKDYTWRQYLPLGKSKRGRRSRRRGNPASFFALRRPLAERPRRRMTGRPQDTGRPI